MALESAIEVGLVTPALPASITQLAQIGGIGKALGILSSDNAR